MRKKSGAYTTEDIHKISRAAVSLEQALKLLDEAQAPANLGAQVEMVLHQTNDLLSRVTADR